MATYYIATTGNDAADGSSGTPWRTLTKGAATAVAGDTVIVKNGTYVAGSISFNNSGTSGNRITFMAENQWQAIISSTSGCNPACSILGSYITLKDFLIQVDATNSTCGVYTSANADIRAWNTIDPSPSNNTTGLVGFVADGIKTTGTFADRSCAIKSNQDFTEMVNCDTNNLLELLNVKQSDIHDNIVRGQDQFGHSILVKGGARDCRVYNNEIRNAFTAGHAIVMGGDSCASCCFDDATMIEAYNCVAFNNVVVNQVTASYCNAVIFQGAKDCAVYNNVFVGVRLVAYESGNNGIGTVNPKFVNNIVIAQSASGSPWSGTFGFAYSGTFTCNYNNFFNFSTQPAQAVAITGDPLLVNRTSDWNLSAGSPCRDAGTPLTFTGYSAGSLTINFDWNGATRTEPWDLGIYNYAAEESSSSTTTTAAVALTKTFGTFMASPT